MSEETIELCLDDPDSVQQRAIRVYLASPMTSQPTRAQLQNARARAAITSALVQCKYAFFQVYDPSEHTLPGTAHSAEQVYRIDLKETFSSDLIVLHVNGPSTGLGIEAQLAANAAVPRMIVSPRAVPLSRMLLGVPVDDLGHIAYDSIQDLQVQLETRLPAIARAIAERLPARRRFMDSVRGAQLGKFLLKARIRRAIGRRELARNAQLPEEHIQSLECCDECAIGLTAMHANQIGTALNCRYRPLSDGAPRFEENDGLGTLSEVGRESLDNLVTFVLHHEIRNECRIFEIWRDYAEMMSHGIAGRESLTEPYTESDWEEAFGADNSLF